MAKQEITPDTAPNADPVCSAKRRPNAWASMPTGIVPSHMPTIMTLMGNVAKVGSGASVAPAMPPVATITLTLAPASACAAASTSALRAASRSSTAGTAGSAIAVMYSKMERQDTRSLGGGSPTYPFIRHQLDSLGKMAHRGSGRTCS
jgi:hypothetical protein